MPLLHGVGLVVSRPKEGLESASPCLALRFFLLILTLLVSISLLLDQVLWSLFCTYFRWQCWCWCTQSGSDLCYCLIERGIKLSSPRGYVFASIYVCPFVHLTASIYIQKKYEQILWNIQGKSEIPQWLIDQSMEVIQVLAWV